ncbi:MAG: heme exporter protein CcmB [Spirosomaceae bacterium]|nr:heme exporter protein CcmB [Spirosomataceae bacterium]
MNELKALIEKEIRLEWRQRYALNGMLLYVISTVFVCYLGFKVRMGGIDPLTWNTLFWIIILFTATTSISKSFTQERAGRLLYYYTIANPKTIILSKIIYNSFLMTVLSVLGFGFYALVMDNPLQNQLVFLVSIVLGSMAFAGTLTLISGIASKAENNSTLMAVMSFPLILPSLLIVMKLAKNALDGLAWSASYDEIGLLIALNILVVAMSYILFPFLWRS